MSYFPIYFIHVCITERVYSHLLLEAKVGLEFHRLMQMHLPHKHGVEEVTVGVKEGL